MARIPNQDLINIRNTFGVNPEFLLSDLNDYTMEGPGNDIIPIDDGIASIDTDLPIYTQDRDGGNNFLQYSDEGAPAYIRDRETAAPMNNDLLNKFNQYENYKYTDQDYIDQINAMRRTNPNFNSYTDQDLKQMIDMGAFSKRSNFEVPEKTGILESIKDGGSKLLDFIKSGGITGNILKGLGALEQNPDAILMRDYYGGEDGSNIKDGTIQSGLMAGYNPVSGGFLNAISGGRFGRPTNYGLQRAYQKQINMIQNNLNKNIYKDPLKKIEKLKKLKEEKRKEAMALEQRTIDRAREANPDVYRNAANVPGALGPGGGFSTTGREGAFSSKSGRGRQDY